MDMLVADLALKNEVAKSKKGSKAAEEEDEAAFHFIAFVPAQGIVWKFDGFDDEPRKLGKLIRHVSHQRLTQDKEASGKATGLRLLGPTFSAG
jgi:hypothetical protein